MEHQARGGADSSESLDQEGPIDSSTANELPVEGNPGTITSAFALMDLGPFNPLISPYYVPEIYNSFDPLASAGELQLLHLLLKLQGGSSISQSCAYKQVSKDWPTYNRYLLEVVRVMANARMSTQERQEALAGKIPVLATVEYGWSFTNYSKGLRIPERIDIQPPTLREHQFWGDSPHGVIKVYDSALIATYTHALNQATGMTAELHRQGFIRPPRSLLTRSGLQYSLPEQLAYSAGLMSEALSGLPEAWEQFRFYDETIKKADTAIRDVITAFADPTTLNEKTDRLRDALDDARLSMNSVAHWFGEGNDFGGTEIRVLQDEIIDLLDRFDEFFGYE
ncbi:hypothetical protein F5Y18DRAFT_424794 [Xylariaceae sp. FL1019]|nr:hypothetical protein F5Y18DRAFT_424794 [Xylariaceae sp. FL1019]